MRLKRYLNFLIALIFLTWLPPAHAHKTKLFAMASGEQIQGYVYFPGGERAKSVLVKIYLPDNQLAATVTTNDNGEFQFHAQHRATHHLVADLGEGHRAEYTIDSSELSDKLPIPSINCKKGSLSETMQCLEDHETVQEKPLLTPETSEKIPIPAPPILTATSNENPSFSQQQLSDLIEKIVSQQLKPLREQLEAYQEKIFLHDVLGGIGYIFGVMGLLFYFNTLRRRH